MKTSLSPGFFAWVLPDDSLRDFIVATSKSDDIQAGKPDQRL